MYKAVVYGMLFKIKIKRLFRKRKESVRVFWFFLGVWVSFFKLHGAHPLSAQIAVAVACLSYSACVLINMPCTAHQASKRRSSHVLRFAGRCHAPHSQTLHPSPASTPACRGRLRKALRYSPSSPARRY